MRRLADRPKRQQRARWVHLAPEGFVCEHCAVRETLPVEMTRSDFERACGAFLMRHRGCPAPLRAVS